MNENTLIVGATSAIARSLCHVMSRRGCRLILAGRDESQLRDDAADLHFRHGNDVFVERFDALDFDDHAPFFDRCVHRFDGNLNGVVVCFGYLTSQTTAQANFSEARRTIDVNLTGCLSLLELAASHLQSRGEGYLAAISSVAGDRGRQSNYIYGAAKAALSTYLQGLRNRLHKSGVKVLTIKPGFVDTPMSQGLVNPKSPLLASPDRVARDIDAAIRKRKDVIYTPWFWWWIMNVIRSIPEPIFKRLSL